MKFDLPYRKTEDGKIIIWNKEFYGIKTKLDISGFGNTGFTTLANLIIEKELGSYPKGIITRFSRKGNTYYDNCKTYCAVGSINYDNTVSVCHYYYESVPEEYKRLVKFEDINGINSLDIIRYIKLINQKYGIAPVVIPGNCSKSVTNVELVARISNGKMEYRIEIY